MLRLHHDVSEFFQELLIDLDCRDDTKAYIVSIFGKYKSSTDDLSQHSAGELFCQARQKQNFNNYQKLADWLFFTRSIAPQHLHRASEDYYATIARLSYYACYKIIPSWILYEEIADRFLILEEQVKKRLPKLIPKISWDNRIVLYD